MSERLKNATAHDWITALERDGFVLRKGRGSHHIYQHPDGRRVLVVYHRLGETFGPKTTRQMLTSTGWSEDDLKRVRLL